MTAGAAPGAPPFDAKRLDAPRQPGVYLMKDREGGILYIGKAKNLRSRVMSYFSGGQGYKTQKLVSRMADVEFVVTDSEEEAFLLESNLIKRYRPVYNIELKDQHRYTYLRVTDEEYPRLLVARRTRRGRFAGGGRVYGPFTSGSSKLLTVGTLRKSFQVRICKTLPSKACLEYHLGNCEAPCEFAAGRERYAGHVRDLESVLKGGDGMHRYADRLRGEMDAAAASLEFERAAEIRDTLGRLSGLGADQKMERAGGSSPDEDYFGIRMDGDEGGEGGRTASVMSLRQSGGVIMDRERFEFDVMADNTFSGFLYQYYSTRRIPGRVSVSREPEDARALEGALSRRAGRRVAVSVPGKTGRRRRMIDLVLRNIDLIRAAGAGPGLAELAAALGLAGPPRAIECFDVSNHGEDYAVGAMSRLVDGLPDRGGYRKFRIRTVSGRDDYAMVAEVVGRRYRRLLSEGSPMPDLVVVDGGKGQLAAAAGALDAAAGAGRGPPCVSIAKREEEVFGPAGAGREGPADLPRGSQALRVVQLARDEAHRFGVAYNRSLRRIGAGGLTAAQRRGPGKPTKTAPRP